MGNGVRLHAIPFHGALVIARPCLPSNMRVIVIAKVRGRHLIRIQPYVRVERPYNARVDRPLPQIIEGPSVQFIVPVAGSSDRVGNTGSSGIEELHYQRKMGISNVAADVGDQLWQAPIVAGGVILQSGVQPDAIDAKNVDPVAADIATNSCMQPL